MRSALWEGGPATSCSTTRRLCSVLESCSSRVTDRERLKDIVCDNECEKGLLSEVIPPCELGVKFEHIRGLDAVKEAMKEVVVPPGVAGAGCARGRRSARCCWTRRSSGGSPRRIMMDLPDAENRVEILNLILSEEGLAPDFAVDGVAAAAEGYADSDLKVSKVSEVKVRLDGGERGGDGAERQRSHTSQKLWQKRMGNPHPYWTSLCSFLHSQTRKGRQQRRRDKKRTRRWFGSTSPPTLGEVAGSVLVDNSGQRTALCRATAGVSPKMSVGF